MLFAGCGLSAHSTTREGVTEESFNIHLVMCEGECEGTYGQFGVAWVGSWELVSAAPALASSGRPGHLYR